MSNRKTILSLFDYSGNWIQPYREAGYNVIQVDIKHGIDVFELFEDITYQSVDYNATVYGILAAPPCTDFAASGAKWFIEKNIKPAEYHSDSTSLEFNNTVDYSIGLILCTLEIIGLLKPRFWAIENPVGRLNSLVPEIAPFGPWYFQPNDYGDPYTKKTGLWGVFNKPIQNPVLPLFGSEMWSRYGGKSDKTKIARGTTPRGFAMAFFNANQ